jgi:nitrous oxidase accessory protein
MRPPRSCSTPWLAVWALTLFEAGCARGSAAPQTAAARGRAVPVATEAGPVALAIPDSASVAETSADLARMLADPDGSQEIWLRAKRYDGDFRVARRVAIRGELGAILHGTGRGTVLTLEADGASVDNVVVRHSGQRHTTEDAGIRAKGSRIRIRNVRVEDALFGITLAPCPHCEIERSYVQGPTHGVQLKGDGIKLWESDDAVVRSCVVDQVRDVVVWYSRRVLLEGNTVRGSRYGSHFMFAHDSVVRDSHVENNVVGIFVMYCSRLIVENNVLAGSRGAAGVGLGFKDSDAVQVRGNWIVANTTGTYLDETPRSANMPMEIAHNAFALNDVAVRFHGVREQLRFSQNDFEQNTVLADVEGGGDALFVQFRGNHFSDYVGYDLDEDGIGDVAYQVKRLSGDLVAAHPMLALFQGTVAMSMIDAIATAVPVFASRLLLQDMTPAVAGQVIR